MVKKNRQLVDVLSKRLSEKAPLIQVVVGPRQVGKTTAIKEVLKKGGLYQSADSPTPLNSDIIEGWWSEAEKNDPPILAIDEVQKINAWSEQIKKLWDKKKPGFKLLLSGSAALLVEKGLKETMAGRFEIIKATHWSFEEAKTILDLSLEDYINFGCYPGAVPLLSDLSRWGHYVRDSIVEPAIGRDLLQLHPVDRPALLRQVFGVAVAAPADIVSLHKIQGQLQDKGALETLQNYLHLLGGAFLVTGIQKYSEQGLRIRRSPPKLIVHDNALLRAFERPLGLKLSPQKFGKYFENLVGARFIESGWEVFYWNDRNKEVDFVVLGPNGEKWAIEVKSTETSNAELAGLRKFSKRYPDFKLKLISYMGQKMQGIESLNFTDLP